MGVSTGRIRLSQTGGQLVCPRPNAIGNFRADVRRFGLPLVGYNENRKIFGRTQDDDTTETSSSPILSDQTIMRRGLRSYRPSERLLELPIVDRQPGLLRQFHCRD
jgi:hypothetical protein